MLQSQPSSEEIIQGAEKYIAYFEHLSLETCADVKALVTENIYFHDPYNEVTGKEIYPKVYEKILHDLSSFEYTFHEKVLSGNQLYLYWTFCGIPKQASFALAKIETKGMSMVVFDQHGKVERHEDFWDTGEAIYAKLPVIKSILQKLKQRMGIQN